MKKMKVAVIADVHANIFALKAFTAYLATTDIEQVWNLGDFLQIGPHPAEVADLLLQDSRFVSILGNNEEALLRRDRTGFPEDEIAHQDWTIAQLGDDRLGRISEFPSMRSLTVFGKQVLLAHEEQEVNETMHAYDLLCYGHTHQSSCELRGAMMLLNPGSLGFMWGQTAVSASFGVLEFHEKSISMRYHAIPYDGSALQQDYVRRQVPGRERIFSMFFSEG